MEGRERQMGDDKDAFYVVRKGDIVGIYTNFNDCQCQLASSMVSPAVTVYKGYGLTKEAEEYLGSHGLKNSFFSISASDVKEGIFGDLMVCPFQHPSSANVKASEYDLHFPQRKNQDSLGVGTMKADPFSSFLPSPSLKRRRLDGCSKPIPASKSNASGSPSFLLNSSIKQGRVDSVMSTQAISSSCNASGSPSFLLNSSIKQGRVDSVMSTQAISSSCKSCILEFDGASKGNPGISGAGAVLRADDGVVFLLREGVGIATNNVAEYRSVLLGLKHALSNGFKHVRARGDSKLVCMQVQGLWKCKNPNMAKLCKEVIGLKDRFSSFEIEHVLREFNGEADGQANKAIYLRDGEIQVDCITK